MLWTVILAFGFLEFCRRNGFSWEFCLFRLCVRRQSARLKHEEIKAEEDLFQTDDAKYSVHQPSHCDSIQENSSASVCTSSNNIENNPASQNESRELKRPSLSRPSRQAARKVQSYKEIPLNVKMRRSEWMEE